MNESHPVPTCSPVRWSERLVAGALAAAWVGWAIGAEYSPVHWWRRVRKELGYTHQGWQDFVNQSAGDLMAFFDSSFLLGAGISALWCALHCGIPALIVGGMVVASGRCRSRNWLWWLALGHGVLLWLQLVFQGRFAAITKLVGTSSWHAGWLAYFEGERLIILFGSYWPCLVEMLLAALIVGFMRRPGRQRKAGNEVAG